MPSLPPLTDRFESYRDVLAAARRRWKEAWSIDPRDGCLEPPTVEFGSMAVLAAAGLAVLLLLSSLVTVIFTRGPVLWVQLALLVLLGGFSFLRMRGNTAALRRQRRESIVTTGAIVMGNNKLFDIDDTDSAWACALVVLEGDGPRGGGWGGDDPAADAETLADLAERAYEEWREAEPDEVADELREAVLYVCQDTPIRTRVEIPELWAGRRGVWITGLFVERSTLPRGVLSRRVMPMLVHPRETLQSVELLPPAFWWREDVDDLTRAWS